MLHIFSFMMLSFLILAKRIMGKKAKIMKKAPLDCDAFTLITIFVHDYFFATSSPYRYFAELAIELAISTRIDCASFLFDNVKDFACI